MCSNLDSDRAVEFVPRIRKLAALWAKTKALTTDAIDAAVAALLFLSTLYNATDVDEHVLSRSLMDTQLIKELPTAAQRASFTARFESLVKTKKLRRTARFMVPARDLKPPSRNQLLAHCMCLSQLSRCTQPPRHFNHSLLFRSQLASQT